MFYIILYNTCNSIYINNTVQNALKYNMISVFGNYIHKHFAITLTCITIYVNLCSPTYFYVHLTSIFSDEEASAQSLYVVGSGSEITRGRSRAET